LATDLLPVIWTLHVSQVKHIQTSTNMPMFYLATLKGQYKIYCCHFLHQRVLPLYSKQLSDQAK